MEKFQLSILFKIIGIGSTSGLIYQNDSLYIISDNSTYLYEYSISKEKLNKIALTKNPQENIPKKDKPDFEAMTSTQGVIFILGSGSTANRNQVYIHQPKSAMIEHKDFTELYQKMKTQLYLTDDELNIEGFIFAQNGLFFFQRGNGVNGKNGIIFCSDNKRDPEIVFFPFDLPVIKNNVRATFTDAILVDDKIYFLASAEDTNSTYLDGEVLGSIVGTIDLKTMKLEKTIQISDKNKFEGITLYKESATQIEFLLCEDNDSELLETNIYKLVIDKTK